MSLIAVLSLGITGAKAVEVEKHQAFLSYDEGLRALFRGDDEAALVALKYAISLDSSLADAHCVLGLLYGKQEQWKEAARAFQSAVLADANYIEAYCELGETYLIRLARVTDAILPLQKAIQMDPDHARARRLLGTAYFRQNQIDEAIAELQSAVKLDPFSISALYTLGLAYFQIDDFEAASLRFKQILERDAFFARAHFSLGNTYLRMGRMAEGQKALRTFEALTQEKEQITHLKRLLRQDLSNVEAWFQLGRLQLKRKMWDVSAEAFEKCIALNPQDIRSYEALGYLYFQRKAYENALEMYSKVVERRPNIATYRNSLGGIYLMLERYPQAIEQYQVAIRLKPEDSRFHLNLSQAYKRGGDNASAEEAHHRYERLKNGKK